jgi:hypothetical protein
MAKEGTWKSLLPVAYEVTAFYRCGSVCTIFFKEEIEFVPHFG